MATIEAQPPVDDVIGDAPAQQPDTDSPEQTSEANGEAPSAGAQASAAPAEGAVVVEGAGRDVCLPTTPTINGDTIRHYLNTHISGPVMAGLKKIAREQPADPVRALGEYLIQLADSAEKNQA